jgi:hypothetical protein
MGGRLRLIVVAGALLAALVSGGLGWLWAAVALLVLSGVLADLLLA